MFISFEGIDFCGKSTQIELLKNFLIKRGNEVEIIREPGGTEISEIIRNILLDKKNLEMFMEAEILLFAAARAQLVREKIRPFLNKGIYVISDRFHDSTTAYQGFGRGISLESVQHIHKISVGNTIPDMTFLIDIPVDVAQKRKIQLKQSDLDRIEVADAGFFENVRAGYLYLAEHESRFRVINGTLPIEKIHKEIIDELTLFEKKENR
ncbi:MAG: dTMP kinase [Ignavibacteriaceae bacterium]|jgi:dTMP kinase|nr:dTMP kinase [Ignavibacteriaceae bacterium]